MAVRPAWKFDSNINRVVKDNFTFTFYSGFSLTQKKKCIASLHSSIPSDKVLEVSTKGDIAIGNKLSAFNLKLDGIPLECVFQAGKVYENGGPFTNLLNVSPKEAKRFNRERNLGKIIGFVYNGKEFPTEPKTLFYDYLYIKAVKESVDIEELKEILDYEYFTDIEFNPNKSINSQARTIVIIKAMLEIYGEIPEFEDFKELEKFSRFIGVYNNL